MIELLETVRLGNYNRGDGIGEISKSGFSSGGQNHVLEWRMIFICVLPRTCKIDDISGRRMIDERHFAGFFYAKDY
jgi:hypothetical protein